MTSIKNKKRTNYQSTQKYKKNKKYNKKTNKYSRKNIKKRTKKRRSKKHSRKNIKRIKLRYKKRGGGEIQTSYWSPMRKLDYNPSVDNTNNTNNTNEINTPAYNCRNPVSVVQNGGNCPYMAKGASSYALNPRGLSNGLIIENNNENNNENNDPSILFGGGLFKTKYSRPKVVKATNKTNTITKQVKGSICDHIRSTKNNTKTSTRTNTKTSTKK